MNRRTSEDLVRDAYIAQGAAIYSIMVEILAEQRKTNARMDLFEEALPTRQRYSHAEACRVLGISDSQGRRYPELLPEPVSTGPLMYAKDEVLERAATKWIEKAASV